jgi:hypothetical protein
MSADKWLGSLRSAEESIQAAQRSLEAIARCIESHVAAADGSPTGLARELNEHLCRSAMSLDNSRKSVAAILEDLEGALSL